MRGNSSGPPKKRILSGEPRSCFAQPPPSPECSEKLIGFKVRRTVRSGSIADPLTNLIDNFGRASTFHQAHVRFTPKSGHVQRTSLCLLWAKSGHSAIHSIISSATSCMEAGTERPSALAVLRLMTSSNLANCTIGRSAGFSPFRIFPV
jgi:hypothetical protein